MKRPGFKRQQTATAAARAFREHPDRNAALFEVVHHFRNGTVRFCAVITVNQQVTRQPVELAENE